jgi:hypothetical protein
MLGSLWDPVLVSLELLNSRLYVAKYTADHARIQVASSQILLHNTLLSKTLLSSTNTRMLCQGSCLERSA